MWVYLVILFFAATVYFGYLAREANKSLQELQADQARQAAVTNSMIEYRRNN